MAWYHKQKPSLRGGFWADEAIQSATRLRGKRVIRAADAAPLDRHGAFAPRDDGKEWRDMA